MSKVFPQNYSTFGKEYSKSWPCLFFFHCRSVLFFLIDASKLIRIAFAVQSCLVFVNSANLNPFFMGSSTVCVVHAPACIDRSRVYF